VSFPEKINPFIETDGMIDKLAMISRAKKVLERSVSVDHHFSSAF
jgi:hypothetical protein